MVAFKESVIWGRCFIIQLLDEIIITHVLNNSLYPYDDIQQEAQHHTGIGVIAP